MLLAQLNLELEQLAERMDQADTAIAQSARQSEACQRLVAMPGIGPVTATAMIVASATAPFKTERVIRNRAKRIPSWPGVVTHSNKAAYIRADLTCQSQIFACGEAADHTYR